MQALGYVEVNLICVAVLVILLASMVRRISTEIRDKLYRIMLISSGVLCLGDAVSALCNGKTFALANFLLWFSNILFFASSVVVGYAWLLYSSYVMYNQIKRKLLYIGGSIYGAFFLFFILTPLHKLLFYIDQNNIYYRGQLIWLHWVIMFASVFIPAVLVWFVEIDKTQRTAISLFVIIPLITMIIQAVFYGISIVQAGLTCALLILYILIQSQIVDDNITKVKELDELSNTDAMTGLRNRRAFNTTLKNSLEKEWVGTAFMDLNGLKLTNDRYGHQAGDAMICRFANFLKLYFNENEVFRISGDEFDIISYNQPQFNVISQKMIDDMSDMACGGATCGSGKDINDLINKAEKLMYEAKAKYYAKIKASR